MTTTTREAIEGEIRAAIDSGALGPGDPLPTMQVLAEAHGVTRQRVAQILEALVAEGLLCRRPATRRGLFVAGDEPEPEPEPLSLDELLRRAGGQAGGATLRVPRKCPACGMSFVPRAESSFCSPRCQRWHADQFARKLSSV